MLKVWREDEGDDCSVEMDMSDPELASCKFADEDGDGAGDYWEIMPPVIVVENSDGERTRWRVSAMTEHVAYREG